MSNTTFTSIVDTVVNSQSLGAVLQGSSKQTRSLVGSVSFTSAATKNLLDSNGVKLQLPAGAQVVAGNVEYATALDTGTLEVEFGSAAAVGAGSDNLVGASNANDARGNFAVKVGAKDSSGSNPYIVATTSAASTGTTTVTARILYVI